MEPNRLWLVQDLADQTECSEKTIRNDLKVIEEHIVQHSSGHLVKRPGLGVYLEIGEADQANLFHRLYSNESTTENETDEEGSLHLAYRLLMNAKPVTLQNLASPFYVNKAIIRRDMEKIEDWSRGFDLSLMTKQRVGFMIEGTEKNKRMALARLNQLINRPELTGQMMRNQYEPHEIATVYNELKALQSDISSASPMKPLKA